MDVEKAQQWDGRGHFFAAAAEAMRRILVENARRKGRIKHGGQRERIDIEIADLPTRMPPEELIALSVALVVNITESIASLACKPDVVKSLILSSNVPST